MTGAPIEYNEDQEVAIADALAGAIEDEMVGFDTIKIRGDVEWAGESRGVRTTRLSVADSSNLVAPLQKYRETGRASSYRAKGWHAQIRALSAAGDRGSRAADRAGLSVTAPTLRHWLAEDRAPTAANQAKISAAYERLAHGGRDKAAHELVRALNEEIQAAEGVPVRVTDLEWLTIE